MVKKAHLYATYKAKYDFEPGHGEKDELRMYLYIEGPAWRGTKTRPGSIFGKFWRWMKNIY